MRQLQLAKRVPVTCVHWGHAYKLNPAYYGTLHSLLRKTGDDVYDGFVVNNETGEMLNVSAINTFNPRNQLNVHGQYYADVFPSLLTFNTAYNVTEQKEYGQIVTDRPLNPDNQFDVILEHRAKGVLTHLNRSFAAFAVPGYSEPVIANQRLCGAQLMMSQRRVIGQEFTFDIVHYGGNIKRITLEHILPDYGFNPNNRLQARRFDIEIQHKYLTQNKFNIAAKPTPPRKLNLAAYQQLIALYRELPDYLDLAETWFYDWAPKRRDESETHGIRGVTFNPRYRGKLSDTRLYDALFEGRDVAFDIHKYDKGGVKHDRNHQIYQK